MNQIEFVCEVVTPMFMTGANRRTPELRPSEFKGMMRFWWRAIKAENNIEELRKEEAELFGGTGEGEGESKIRIRIIDKKLCEGNYRVLPHKKFSPSCVREGSNFTILLSAFEDIDFYNDIFIISTILGGFGKRSRRGFGSIDIEGVPVTLENIVNLLCKIKNIYKIQNSKIINKSVGGKYPWIKEIDIGKSHNNMNYVLSTIWQSSHNYKDPSLGNASPRMASPIYVSVIKQDNSYKPIITVLNSYFPQPYPRWDFAKQKGFKRSLL